jgi:hypothetical protein
MLAVGTAKTVIAVGTAVATHPEAFVTDTPYDPDAETTMLFVVAPFVQA